MSELIKFNPAENGTIPVVNGATALSDLFAIGALAVTAKHIETNGAYQKKFETDKKGLETMLNKAEYTASFLTDAMHNIGLLLAHVDTPEIQDNMNSIGWLIANLSELSCMVATVQAEIDYSLKTDYQA